MATWIRRPQEDALDEWLTQPTPCYWPLRGEGGMGKSSLLRQFFRRARDAGKPVVITSVDRFFDRSERIAADGLINLEVASVPAFTQTRDLITEVRSTFKAAMEGVGEGGGGWAWDMLASVEAMVDGSGVVVKSLEKAAGALKPMFEKVEAASARRPAASTARSRWTNGSATSPPICSDPARCWSWRRGGVRRRAWGSNCRPPRRPAPSRSRPRTSANF